jgi:hypothetical protein
MGSFNHQLNLFYSHAGLTEQLGLNVILGLFFRRRGLLGAGLSARSYWPPVRVNTIPVHHVKFIT